MKINVTRDNVVIIEKSDAPHENEYKITKCYFTFDEFTDSFQVKRAIFTILSTGEMFETDIINNECYVPIDVLKHELETIKVGVYGYNIEIVNEKETLKERFSPSYTTFVVPSGSYEEGALSPEIITPSQYDIYSQALQEGLEEVSHVDIDASKSGRTATITITNRNNEEKSVQVSDGISIENMEIEDNHLWVTYNEPTEPQDLGQVVPIKGQDYFTTSEIEEIEGTVKEQVKTDLDFDNTISRIDSDIQDLNTNKASKTELESETSARELADTNLQGQIDAITSSKDVVDIVGTYQDLMNYDTTSLTEDDVIKVLDDSTHNDAMSYYRWSNNTWNYVGSEGPFYTRSETDERLNTKQPTIDSTHKLSSDLVDDTNQTNKFTSTNEKNTWNAKYDKPNTGIPKSDLVASVQESLDKADTAIQDVSDKEDKSNKVTEINSSSTDTQYPSAKCVYYSQEEQNEHIAELEMLYNAFPTVSDEDTTIQLDNTAKVKFREIDLKGNTSQVVIPEEQGTSVSNTSISISDVNTDKEHTIEMSGNTYQEGANSNNLFDGTLELGSIHYDTGQNQTNNNAIRSKNYIPIGSVTKFNIILDEAYSSGQTMAFRFYDSNFNYIGRQSAINVTNYRGVFTDNSLDTSKTAVYVRFSVTTSNDLTKNFCVRTDDSTTYEPPKPNPDYPQNIEAVTGTQNITIANSDNTQSTTYPINLGNIELCKIGTYKDRIYKSNNKWYLYKEIGKVILNGTQTTIARGTSTTGYNRFAIDIGTNIYMTSNALEIAPFYCNEFIPISRTNSYANINGIFPGVESSFDYYRSLGIYYDATKEMTSQQFQTWLSQNNVIVYYPYATPTITEITDTTLVNQLNALYNATIYPITNINTETSNLLPYIDLHYNFVTPSPSPSRPSVVNVVKGNNTITISNSDNTESQAFPINLGDIELCKIGTYQDYIYKSNGNWYKKNNIGKVVLNGSESWQYISVTQGSLFRNNDIITNDINDNTYIPYSNNYKGIAYNNYLNRANNQFYIQTQNDFLDIIDNRYTSASDFKTWLSTHNTTVYYPLATPTDTQITDTTLITQLNNIKKAYSYDTQTNISQTNTDKPFIIYAEAIRSLKDVFE